MSRRAAVFGVVLISQLVGMAMAVAFSVAGQESLPVAKDLVLAVAAGAVGVVGITALYRGLAVGRMGIVAPVTGVLGATIPVIAGIGLEGPPATIVLVGIVLALLAVLLVSRVQDEGGGRSGLGLALLSGSAIGCFSILISRLDAGHVYGDLVIIRGTETVLLVGVIVATRAAWRPPRALVPAIVGIGVADMAGNAFYLLALQAGTLAVAAVVSSLYPVTTVILAATVLHERVTRSHAVGIALAAVAVALIGIGNA
jgi:drug/metabolite transporter (DMT)-like permease